MVQKLKTLFASGAPTLLQNVLHSEVRSPPFHSAKDSWVLSIGCRLRLDLARVFIRERATLLENNGPVLFLVDDRNTTKLTPGWHPPAALQRRDGQQLPGRWTGRRETAHLDRGVRRAINTRDQGGCRKLGCTGAAKGGHAQATNIDGLLADDGPHAQSRELPGTTRPGRRAPDLTAAARAIGGGEDAAAGPARALGGEAAVGRGGRVAGDGAAERGGGEDDEGGVAGAGGAGSPGPRCRRRATSAEQCRATVSSRPPAASRASPARSALAGPLGGTVARGLGRAHSPLPAESQKKSKNKKRPAPGHPSTAQLSGRVLLPASGARAAGRPAGARASGRAPCPPGFSCRSRRAPRLPPPSVSQPLSRVVASRA